MDITSIIESQPVELPPDNVFNLPCSLSHLQRELLGIILSLHRDELIEGLSEDGALNTEYVKVLVNNWGSILTHPFLLVDHFVPKNLLLMESSPNLVKDSGKFKKFDELINKLEGFQYNVIVTASSIKEIDIIESYLLGRKLNYKRYTGASLYDLNNIPEPSTRNPQNSSNLTKKKRNDHYSSRMSQNNPQVQYMLKNPKNKLTLHLLSSNQLKTMNFNNKTRFHFIVSFDPYLSNVEYLRQAQSVDSNLIPVIKLMVFNSVEQYKLTNDKDLVAKAIVNMDKDFETEIDSNWLLDYTKVQWTSKFTDCAVPDSTEVINLLQSYNETPALKKIKSEFASQTDYKSQLTQSIKDRIDLVKESITRQNDELDRIRYKESELKLAMEQLNVEIGDMVKLKQQLEVELNGLNKRVEKLDSDVTRLSTTKENKNAILKSDSLETIEIDESELEKLNLLNEQIRNEYQLNSSKLLESSMKLKIVTSENAGLKTKLDNSDQTKIREQLLVQNSHRQQYIDSRLKSQNEFLTQYSNKISSIVRINNIMDSSRSSNGRLSRSSTPRV